VGVGRHEGSHRGLIAPRRDRPEGLVNFGKGTRPEIPLGPTSLSGGTYRQEQESRQEAPGAHSESGYGDERHADG